MEIVLVLYLELVIVYFKYPQTLKLEVFRQYSGFGILQES
jgi:hypothetical protein